MVVSVVFAPAHRWPSYRRHRLAMGCLVLFFAVACSSTSDKQLTSEEWTREFLEVTRLDPQEADDGLAALAERAPSEERAREAEFERARIALRSENIELARTRLQTMWDDRQDDSYASRALYELGRIAAEHDEDTEAAHRLLQQTITETPPWAGSEFALQFLIRTERRAGRTAALVDHLEQMAHIVADDRMASQLHLERGLLLDEELNQPNRALEAFRLAFQRCETCGATDEALYQMGEIYARHQRWDPAVASLDIVARRTGRSFFVGTYNSQRAADARFLMGTVEMLHRQNYDAARTHFRKFVNTFPNHVQTHEAAWNVVQIERLAGSQRSYRRALRRFVENYPHSRHFDAAQQYLEEMT